MIMIMIMMIIIIIIITIAREARGKNPGKCSWARASLGPLIELPVLALDVPQEDLGIQGLARHDLEEVVGGRVERAHAVHLLLQPLPQRGEVPGGDVLVQARQLALGRLEDLHRGHGPDGVRGEVADGPHGPVQVLQTALGVVRGLHAEILLHALVPHLGHILDLESALHERLLDLEAQDHVHGVGHLVGLHADLGGPADLVDGPVQLLRRPLGPEALREGLLQLGQEVGGEGLAEADHALPEQGLALVDRHAGRRVDRQAVELQVPALLVEGVACLVDRAGEALHDVVGLEARRHAHVGRVGPACEGVHAHVEAALLEVEAERHGHLLAQRRLLLRVELALEPRVVRRLAVLEHVAQQGDEALLHLVEDLRDPRRR
mmetsp:Transcript_60184/g.176616  ORF Transcript_60184/g.176616 Transcript_60184/m.176616 type:complete len:377 (-) Transcript_60184:739-1869(-)